MWYDDLLEEVSDPETKRLRSLAVRAINQGMYDDGANLAVRARNAAMAGRTRAERADLHLDLIAYGPARHLVSAAVRHLLANQYEECLHAIQLAGALYEYSNASDYDLKEYWEIVGLAYRGLGDEPHGRVMNDGRRFVRIDPARDDPLILPPTDETDDLGSYTGVAFRIRLAQVRLTRQLRPDADHELDPTGL